MAPDRDLKTEAFRSSEFDERLIAALPFDPRLQSGIPGSLAYSEREEIQLSGFAYTPLQAAEKEHDGVSDADPAQVPGFDDPKTRAMESSEAKVRRSFPIEELKRVIERLDQGR